MNITIFDHIAQGELFDKKEIQKSIFREQDFTNDF